MTLDDFINIPCGELEKDLNKALFYAPPVNMYEEERA